MLASKTKLHFGCQRLTPNIFPAAAAVSRRARCQSEGTKCASYDVSDGGNWNLYLSDSLSFFMSLSLTC